MARCTPRWVIGAIMFAALCTALPAVSTVLAPDATALAYLAALALVAVLATAVASTSLPVPGLTQLTRVWDHAPVELSRQSDPSAAGHSRPRAPDHS